MSTGSEPGFIFALPPSLGPTPVHQIAARLGEHFGGKLFGHVEVASTYSELEDGLLKGRIDIAWGPPIICARTEAAGGVVALRFVRYGATTYRAVLLSRANDNFDLKSLGKPGSRKLRAAWVDAWSMGGCILPRYHLRSRGYELRELLSEESLLESYAACFDAVLNGEADITASFAGRRNLGYVDLCGDRAAELKALAYTDESPNDAIVISPRVPHAKRDEIMELFREITVDSKSKEQLCTSLDVDDFDDPPAGTYSALLALLG